VEMVVSHNISGLTSALLSVFPQARLQICQNSLLRKANSCLVNKSEKTSVRFDIQTIFSAPDISSLEDVK